MPQLPVGKGIQVSPNGKETGTASETTKTQTRKFY